MLIISGWARPASLPRGAGRSRGHVFQRRRNLELHPVEVLSRPESRQFHLDIRIRMTRQRQLARQMSDQIRHLHVLHVGLDDGARGIANAGGLGMGGHGAAEQVGLQFLNAKTVLVEAPGTADVGGRNPPRRDADRTLVRRGHARRY